MAVLATLAAIEARRAKLALLDVRLARCYSRAVGLRNTQDLIQALECGHLVREILDGCIRAAGFELALPAALPRLRKQDQVIERLVKQLQESRTTDADDLRRSVLGMLDTLRPPASPTTVSLTSQLAEVARRLGLPAQAGSEPVARLAQTARDLGAGALHLGDPKDDPELMARAAAALENLELFLDAVEPAFTPRVEAVQAFLQQAADGEPLTDVQAVQLAAFLADPDAYRQFFLELSQPAWLAQLQKHGLMAPRMTAQEGSGGARLDPVWWPGEYLTRIAETTPAAVVNAYLHEAPVSHTARMAAVGRLIALKVPPDDYRRLHKRILQDLAGLRGSSAAFVGRGREAIELVARLNEIGLHGHASAIVTALAAPMPEDEPERNAWHSRRTRAGLGYWDLSNLIKKAVQSMGTSQSTKLFAGLQRVIQGHLEMAYPDSGKKDLTYIGRHNWTAEDRGYEDSIHILLRGLYRESMRLIAAGKSPVDLADELWAMEWSALRRLAMKILAEHPDVAVERGAGILLDHEQFADTTVQQEYARLAEALAPGLQPAHIEAYCEMVATIISPERMRQRLAEAYPDEEPTADVVNRRVAMARASRLAPLAARLVGRWKEEYDAAVQQHGAPRFVYSNVELGPGGAIPPVDLSGQTPDEILDRLRSTSERVSSAPLMEDLYSGLYAEVKRRPDELVAPDFAKKVPRAAISTYLWGISESVRQSMSTRQALAAVEAVKAANAELDEHVMHAMSRVLEEIVRRPSATLEEIETCIGVLEEIATMAPLVDSSNIWDAADHSVNHARTHALEALIDIQRRAVFDEPLHPAAGPPAAAAMKRVVEAWPAGSSALAGVLARHHNFLWARDEEWFRAQRPLLFDAELLPVRQTAWVTYISSNGAADEVIVTLDADYRSALAAFAALRPDERSRHGSSYMENLGLHLASIWYRGLGSPELRQAIQEAPAEVADAVISTLSHQLANTNPGDVPHLIARVGDLLDHYAHRIQASDLRLQHGFALLRMATQEGIFTPARRLGWLRTAFEHIDSVDLDRDDLGHVLRDARLAPEEGAVALALALERAPFYAVREDVAGILDGLTWFAQNGSPGARHRLAQACDLLVRHGHTQYQASFHQFSA